MRTILYNSGKISPEWTAWIVKTKKFYYVEYMKNTTSAKTNRKRIKKSEVYKILKMDAQSAFHYIMNKADPHLFPIEVS